MSNLAKTIDRTERARLLLEHVKSGPSTAPVEHLLAQARAAHMEYRRACASFDVNQQGIVPADPIKQARALTDAATFRAQAELADPDHEQIGWLGEVGTTFEHDNLLDFYHQQLTK